VAIAVSTITCLTNVSAVCVSAVPVAIVGMRAQNVTPRVAQNDTSRRSAIDGHTLRHPGHVMSLRSPQHLILGLVRWVQRQAGSGYLCLDDVVVEKPFAKVLAWFESTRARQALCDKCFRRFALLRIRRRSQCSRACGCCGSVTIINR